MGRVRSRVWVVVVLVVSAVVLALPVAASAASKGVVSVFGSAGTGPGQFSAAADGVRGVAVDQVSGDVYVVDGGNQRVQRFTSSGQFVSQLGSGSVGTAGGLFNGPFGVAVDPADGSVYVSDGLNLRVQKFSSSGSFIRAFGWDTIVAAGPPPNSNGVAFEVCDTTALVPNLASDCKAGVSGTGNGQFAGTHVFTGAPAVDPSTGAVYVADPGAAGVDGRRVQRFSGATGAFEGRFGGQGAGLGQFGTVLAGQASPHRLAVDSAGAVYVVDRGKTGAGSARVQKCVPSGAPPAVSATCSLFASYAQGTDPVAVAVDPADDHVFVARRRNGNDSEVVLDEFASTGGPVLETHGVGLGIAQGVSSSGPINYAAGLAVHGATGRVYFTFPTTSNPRVWVLADVPSPSVTVGEPTDVTSESATLHATVTPAATGPNGVPTRYRFEYSINNGIDWTPASPFNDIGNGSGPGDPASCPTENPPSCEVSLNATGLDPGEDYRVRVVARTDFGGTPITVEGPGFSTPVAPPLATTGQALWSSPSDTNPTLMLTGQINPRGAPATYRFEYVTDEQFAESGFDRADMIPASEADAGAGRRPVVVRQSISGLDPDTAYRFRLVASNGAGANVSTSRVVQPPANDDRFYELVSAGDGWGVGVGPEVDSIADNGERASFVAQGFGQPESVPGPATTYIAERGESGWRVHAPFPAPELAYGLFKPDYATPIASDLGAMLWSEADPYERQRAEAQFALIGVDGSHVAASERIVPLSHTGKPSATPEYTVVAGTPDLSKFVFMYGDPSSKVRLFADEQQVAASTVPASNLYGVSGVGGPSPSISIVNRATDPAPGVPGAPMGGVCGAAIGGNLGTAQIQSGAYRAMSHDGSVIHFTAAPSVPDTGICPVFALVPRRVFKRVDGSSTVAVSESQCVRVSPACVDAGNDSYQAASVDGEVTFFTSDRQLVDSDLDQNTGFGGGCGELGFLGTGCDLYVYDSDPPAGQPSLVQASAGLVNPDHPTIGSGAGVMNFVDAAPDGSRVYFTATGVLAGPNGRGVSPVAGQRNVYVYERDEDHPVGRIAFVAPSAVEDFGADSSPEARFYALSGDGGGDGEMLLFSTAAQALPSEDTDSARDVYRYVDTTGALECLSCSGDSEAHADITSRRAPGVGWPNEAQRGRPASADVSAVVFETSEALVAEDDNTALDVYLWRDGEGLSLVSGGTGPLGVLFNELGVNTASGISPDGRSVFFVTAAPLVASDGNGRGDMYVARVGGGFPAADTPRPCAALAGACHGNGTPPVATQSKTAAGGGNATAGERARLTLSRPSGAARKRAARTGVLVVAVRSSRAGRVKVLARARVGGRLRVVGRAARQLSRPGVAKVTLHLSRSARKRLRSGHGLALTVQARSVGARMRAITVQLPRAGA